MTDALGGHAVDCLANWPASTASDCTCARPGVGVTLTEAERADVARAAGYAPDGYNARADLYPAIERILAAREAKVPDWAEMLATRQAPTVLDREAVARALYIYDTQDATRSREWCEMAWADMGGSEPSDERAEYEMRADAVLALPGVTQAPTEDAMAQALLSTEGCRLEGCTDWATACPWCQSFYGPRAHALVAALRGEG